jgi:hypothetical protein
LLGAHIGGDLDLTGAKVRNKDGNALAADGVQVAGGVFGREGFEVEGEVRLLGAAHRRPDGPDGGQAAQQGREGTERRESARRRLAYLEPGDCPWRHRLQICKGRYLGGHEGGDVLSG